MKKSLNIIIVSFMTLLLASCMSPQRRSFNGSFSGGFDRGGDEFTSFLPLLIVAVIIIIVAIKTSKEDNSEVSSDQFNKVVNITLIGGLIGLFGSSPQNRLNSRIKKENSNGWRVIQIIPAESGNIFLSIFRFLLLLFTLTLYTTTNGYYVIMEKPQPGKQTENSQQTLEES